MPDSVRQAAPPRRGLPHFPPRFSRDALILAGLAFAALVLRAWGVQWSLPYVGHVDEPKIVDAAVRIVKTGDLNPHLFIWPSGVIYVQALLDQLNLIWGTWRGYYHGPDSLPDSNHIFAVAPDLYLWGRLFSATVGAAAVAGVYALGRLMVGRPGALIAAGLLATSPLHVEYSHYLVTDVTMGAAGLFVLAAGWRLVQHPGRRSALVAGAAVGFATAAKYNGLYTVVPVATAWAMAAWSDRLGAFSPLPNPLPAGKRELAGLSAGSALRTPHSTLPQGRGRRVRAAAGAALLMFTTGAAVFLLLNPYVLLDWRDWSHGFVFQVNAYLPAENMGQVATAAGKQLDQLWRTDPILLAVGLLGAAILLGDALIQRRTDRYRACVAALLLPFPILYWLLMSRFTEVYVRNLIVTLPYLALAGGYGVAAVGRGLGAVVGRRAAVGGTPSPMQNSKPRTPNLITLLLGLALMVEPARRVINFDRYMADTESRNAAWAWLQDELHAGRRAAVELHPLQACAAPVGGCLAPDVLAFNAPLTAHAPAWYAARGYDYAVLVGNEVAVVGDNPRRGPANAVAWAALPVVQVFGGDPGGGKGPPVRVLRVGSGPAGLTGYIRSGAHFGTVADLWGYALAPLPTAGAPFDPADLSAPTDSRAPAPSAGSYKAGAAIGVRLAWRGRPGVAPPGNWTVALHLLDPADRTVAQVDVLPISSGRLRPVADWYSNEFLDGSYNIPLPPTLPPGTYRLSLSLYDAPAGRALAVQAPSGPTGPALLLGLVVVSK